MKWQSLIFRDEKKDKPVVRKKGWRRDKRRHNKKLQKTVNLFVPMVGVILVCHMANKFYTFHFLENLNPTVLSSIISKILKQNLFMSFVTYLL